MEKSIYQREKLPVWVQGWLEVKGPALVFVAEKTDRGPYLVDANELGKQTFRSWTGHSIPTYERVEEHKKADLKAWEAFEQKDLNALAALVSYREVIAGDLYETIKTPINASLIVIVTKKANESLQKTQVI